ncbi:MAG: tripartite tricarboxylate transporter substrate binding protein [Polaromonas sp.]|uniref:tripartite tricarboxylate transporter substrate binding protein n=1 Tax=Polaromonas sp. TaxID=1869339 RepID=UPI0025D96F62|nr:tripartite tricarboxylate transporter substrate binding protein [Polaromonas sp.]MBI2726448.1 tripartite tricarboxylate transporter substrate binding protein [Polaromonas sp.]
MLNKTFPQLSAALLATAALGVALSTAAQDAYPSRPVKLVVAQAAGGGPDLLARLVAQELNTQWKQPVIVENRLGAAGGIAAEYVAKSPADGYTLFVGSAGIMGIAPAMQNKLQYSPAEFVPLVHLASLSNVFVVNAKSPIKSMKALVDTAKKTSGGLTVASMGAGSTGQISGEILVRQTGIKTVEVAYKGESLAITDLRGGHFDFMAAGMPVALSHIKAGALTPLAVTGSRRSSMLPDVPTMAESGFRDYDVTQWYAIYAPAALPKSIQARVVVAVRVALANPAVQKQIMEMGMDTTSKREEDFPAFDKAEKLKWEKFMKAGAAR